MEKIRHFKPYSPLPKKSNKALQEELEETKKELEETKAKCNRYAEDIVKISQSEDVQKGHWHFVISFFDVCQHTTEALVDVIISRFERDLEKMKKGL